MNDISKGEQKDQLPGSAYEDSSFLSKKFSGLAFEAAMRDGGQESWPGSLLEQEHDEHKKNVKVYDGLTSQ